MSKVGPGRRQAIPVAVLAGGRSPEHAVSIDSARELLRAMPRDRWQPLVVRLDRNDPVWWVRSSSPDPDEDPFDFDDWNAMHPGVAVAWLQSECGAQVAFPALHGPWGEDGTVQGMLALCDLPCVGSDVAASAVAIDKIRARECLTSAGIPMAEAYVGRVPLHAIDPVEEARRVATTVGFPAFAKVDTSGSSLGVAKVRDRDELVEFLEQHRGAGRRYLVESSLSGEEISVPVLGNAGESVEALTPIGVYAVEDDHFSHDAKYTPGKCVEVVPPRALSTAMCSEVRDLALRCHEALQCDGMSRTDMIVTEHGPFVLEVNTIPGLTQASLLPKCAAHDGIEFPELIDRLLESALTAARRRREGRIS